MDLETKRQLIHFTGVITPVYLLAVKNAFGELAPLLLLLAMLGIGYGISILYRKGVRVPGFSSLIDSAERDKHKPGKGTFRFFTGVFIAYCITLAFGMPYYLFAASVLVLAAGDSMSTLVGIRLGRTRIPYNRAKSVEGALAGFLSAVIVVSLAMFFSGLSAGEVLLIAVLSSITGMLVESLPLPVDDNLTIPVVVVLVLGAVALF